MNKEFRALHTLIDVSDELQDSFENSDITAWNSPRENRTEMTSYKQPRKNVHYRQKTLESKPPVIP